METHCLFADKYDLNQSNGAPEIPKFEVYATKHYDQQCRRQSSTPVTQVREQHAENSFLSKCTSITIREASNDGYKR